MEDIYIITNSSGKTMEVNNATKDRFEEIHKGKGDLSNYKIEKKYQKTTPDQRNEYGGTLAGLFPNITEDVMNDNTNPFVFSKNGSIAASVVQDLATLGPRIYTTATTPGMDFSAKNIGIRQGEGGSGFKGFVSDMARDPMTYMMSGAGTTYGKMLKEGINEGKNIVTSLAKKVMPNHQTAAARTGKYAGTMLTGGAMGAGTEYVDASLNGREEHPIVGMLIGAGFEGVGQVVAALIRKFGIDHVISNLIAMFSGNTAGREPTMKELAEFASQPGVASNLAESCEISSTGANKAPYSLYKNRGNKFNEPVERAKEEAANVLADEDVLQLAYRDGNENPVSANQKRIKNTFDNVNIEEHKPKTAVKKPNGNVNENAEVFSDDIDVGRYEGPAKYQKTNTEFHLDNYGNSLDALDEKFKNLPYDMGGVSINLVDELARAVRGGRVSFETFSDFMNKDKSNPLSEEVLQKMFARVKNFDLDTKELFSIANKGRKSPMTEQEKNYLASLKKSFDENGKVVNGIESEYAANEGNMFANDVNPFSNDYEFKTSHFLANKPKGKQLTQSFKEELDKVLAEARAVVEEKALSLRKDLSPRRSSIFKHIDYSKENPMYVKSGYNKAMNNFEDFLNAHITMLTETSGKNSNGKEYLRKSMNTTKYAAEYLNNINDLLGKQQAIDSDMVTTLYGMATNANDVKMQEAIIKFLEDLGISSEKINKFKEIGGNYARLNKVKTRANTNNGGFQVEKGKTLVPIIPQKGFNAKNAWGYDLQKYNIDLMNLGNNPHNPTPLGTGVRNNVYLLGVPAVTKDN